MVSAHTNCAGSRFGAARADQISRRRPEPVAGFAKHTGNGTVMSGYSASTASYNVDPILMRL